MKLRKPELSLGALKRWLTSNALTLATLLGVILGIILGFALRTSRDEPWSRREVLYVSFIGELFLRALKCVIIPLVVPSIVVAIGSLDVSLSKRIGIQCIVYYLSTTVLAICLGLVLVVSIKPGVDFKKDDDGQQSRNITTADTLMDLVRNMVPANIIEATMMQTTTLIAFDPKNREFPNQNESDLNTWPFRTSMESNTNILGLMSFFIAFGIAIAILGDEAKVLLNCMEGVSNVMMKMTNWIIMVAPVGVLFLVAGQILRMDDLGKALASVGAYFGTVLAGLAIHSLVVLPAIYVALTRKAPFRFYGNMGKPLLTAFSTGSSSATLPVTMETLEDTLQLDQRVTRFVLPIGATVNMDGTALYEAVAAIFIAQDDGLCLNRPKMYLVVKVNGMQLSAVNIIAISVSATMASIGAAGIPQAGLVTMIMVLNTVGLPTSDIALILSVDWLLDRFRTMVNVLGDSFGAAIVHHYNKDRLDAMDKVRESNETESTPTQRAGSNCSSLQGEGIELEMKH